MIYSTPAIGRELGEELQRLDALGDDLSTRLNQPAPWTGTLRRFEQRESYGSSISIEGFSVDPERVAAVSSGSSGPTNDDEAALFYYALAMDHVATMADDPEFEWTSRIILDLHFETCRFQKGKHPGLYRETPIEVAGPRGGPAYRGPPFEGVADLCAELIDSLTSPGSTHPAVSAAMAHLNFVSIHPFEDGNGRMSRVMQSLVLARQGILAPEFGSIEQYLAEDTASYYDELRKVQRGTYSPEHDATSWVEFCVTAHLAQAERRIELVRNAADRWASLEEIVDNHGWDDRLVIALEQALSDKTDRARYGAEADVATATASNDLRRLVDAGYLDQVGKGRTTSYEPSPRLRREAKISSKT